MPAAVLLVGGGKMGGALLAGWLDRHVGAETVVVVEPDSATADALKAAYSVTVVDRVQQIGNDVRPRIVVLAVKPQVVATAIPPYRRFKDAGPVFLSIAAGTPIALFERCLGSDAAVVRAMPNTPAAVRRGMTVACANAVADDDHRRLCGDLLAAVGDVAWVEDEGLMDAVTAVSGSGPAYVFLLAECLAEAGVAAGLSADLSQRLARQTIIGAGELLRLSEEAPSQLRRNVTSPGGTTAAAIDVLTAEGGLGPLVAAAVEAAAKRSRELAG